MLKPYRTLHALDGLKNLNMKKLAKSKPLVWTYYDRDFTFKTTDPLIDLHTDQQLGVSDIDIVYNNTDLNDLQLSIYIIKEWFNQDMAIARSRK